MAEKDKKAGSLKRQAGPGPPRSTFSGALHTHTHKQTSILAILKDTSKYIVHTCLFVCLFVCLSLCLSVCLYVHLFCKNEAKY